MNFSEFKEQLGADPLGREPETRAARSSGPEFEAAASDAEAFEAKLSAAVRVAVDADALLGDILQFTARPARRMPRWMALAASLVLVVGAASIVVRYVQQPDTIEEYVAVHFGHDGEMMLARAADDVGMERVQQVLASWDLQASDELASRVRYIKKCFTMDGLGAHMVVQTEHGNVTLIVMPRTRVQDQQMVRFAGHMDAYLVALGDSSAAVIGRDDQAVAELDSIIRNGISRVS